jgi:carbon storage regulator
MLVLRRKIGEEIILPDLNIKITVVDCRGTKVRLGITAPRNLAVHRTEVWDRICRASDHAALLPPQSPDISAGPLKPR